MQQHQLDRLNLAIARRCFVACKGCYSFFGKHEPDLNAFSKTIAAFVRLGVQDVTISGGDPLTIEGFLNFLTAIRSIGVRTIKVDTVGTSLLFHRPSVTVKNSEEMSCYLDAFLRTIDYLGIPLDGWSNASSWEFRVGRPSLYDETIELLSSIDALEVLPKIIINTVAHRRNLQGLTLILDEVSKHRSVCHWNIFQYTPTDQAARFANDRFEISNTQFMHACNALLTVCESKQWPASPPRIELRSVEARLGKYLLVNSDGDAWIPDANGSTIQLGSVFGREEIVLAQWSNLVHAMVYRKPVPIALSSAQNLIHSGDSVEEH